MADIIHFHRVSHRYDRGPEIISDVSFTLGQGEMAFLTGPSGAGKSTLLRLITLLARPSKGQVLVHGQNTSDVKRRHIPAFRRQIGVIFQNPSLLTERTVFDNVALPLLIRGHSGDDIGRRVRAALDAVGLLGKEKAYPLTLSGGEQQRVGIARAVVAKPPLLLADEPTGNLDPQLAMDVMALFMRFNEVGVSVLVATHAISLVSRLPHRVIHLDKGSLEERRRAALMEKTHDFG
jgi:cell division transport system ATP-binding protein